MSLPQQCEKHPGAPINHTWEEEDIVAGRPVGNLRAKDTHRYECSICGGPLSQPILYPPYARMLPLERKLEPGEIARRATLLWLNYFDWMRRLAHRIEKEKKGAGK